MHGENLKLTLPNFEPDTSRIKVYSITNKHAS